MSTNFAIGIRMALVRRKSAFLSNAPLEVRNDHEVVLTAMQHVPWSQRMGGCGCGCLDSKLFVGSEIIESCSMSFS